MNDLNNNEIKKDKEKENISKKKNEFIDLKLKKYLNSKNFGKPYTFTEETNNQFLLITIKNVFSENKNNGYLAIIENANDVKIAINERKNFIRSNNGQRRG